VVTPLHPNPASSRPSHRSRWEGFFAGYLWLILKNILGWALILASFVLGPFVPGPGGIPMFFIGFALVTFPGKRHLTARVLRGRPFHFWSLRMMLISIAAAVAAPGVGLWVLGNRWGWLTEMYDRGPWAIVRVYVAGVALAWLIAIAGLYFWNLFVRIVPRIRRRVRPWLRRHHVRLLPPRWRARRPHERGEGDEHTGPIRLKDEILAFMRRRHGRARGAKRS
jgi:hypothetical protein